MGAKISSGGSKKRGGYSANGDMNIIPFIDILLVLLIIFMVAAPVPTADVKVDLPPPVPPPETPERPKTPTIVSIRDYGDGTPQIWVDNLVVVDTMDQLADAVTGRVVFNVPDTSNPLLESVRVRADQTLPYGVVMTAMGKLQEAQFQKVSLVAEDALPDGAVAQ
jgi:biopolymer transport protein ExbD